MNDPEKKDVDEQERTVRPLNPATIRRSPYQVRAEETPDDGLVASIATHGLLNPVTVREDEGGATFELIAGHRRLAAWILSRGSQPIPAIVLAADDMAAEDLLVSENFVRRDLTPIEQALTVKQLRDHGRTVDQTAAVVRKSTRWVQRFSAIAGIGQPWARHLAESRASYPRCLAVAQLPPALREQAWDSFCSVVHDGKKDEAWWTDQTKGMPFWTARLRILDAAHCPFKISKVCKNCPKRSDHSPELWDEIEDVARTPRCLDPKCYDKHAAAATEAAALRAQASSSPGEPEEAPGRGKENPGAVVRPPSSQDGASGAARTVDGDAASGNLPTSSVPPREKEGNAVHPGDSGATRGGPEPLSDADLAVRMGVVWTVSQLLHGDKLEDILPRIAGLRAETVQRGGWLAHVRENALPRLSRNQEEARAALLTVERMW